MLAEEIPSGAFHVQPKVEVKISTVLPFTVRFSLTQVFSEPITYGAAPVIV
jgi:hypothetical protein